MKNAVVFGATGQLGCYSALALKDNGYNVYAIGRRESDNGFFATKGIIYIGGVTLEDKASFAGLPKKILMLSLIWQVRCLLMLTEI